MKIRALIVDDEPLARERIRDLLEDDDYVDVIGESANGIDAVTDIREKVPDLIFLDVQMPGLDGFEVVEKVGCNKMPQVIFTTAYDQYALRAFEVHALDYLLKPFDRGRFQNALNRAIKYLKLKKDGDFKYRLKELLDEVKVERKYLDRLIIKSEGRIFFLKVDEIDWIEAAGNYLTLHVGNARHLLRETMNCMENKLDPDRFFRVHRSTIVNIERIKEIHPMFNSEYLIILKNGRELNLSRKYREKFKELF
ncbi:LytR/AlgR family response regulator transcription factor [candidate division KSB1 bacterium]